MNKPQLLKLEDCEIAYGPAAVFKNLNLNIGPGEQVALLGESGSGKTTLLRHLYAVLKPQGVAVVPQDFALVDNLSVFHNVYSGQLQNHSTIANLRNLVFPAAAEKTKVECLLSELQLEQKLLTPVAQLSGGQKQRTAVARAIYAGHTILLADEPVSAVDENQAELVLRLLLDAHETSVFAMHDVELALKFASRIIGLRDGEVMIDQQVAELRSDELSALY